jgi:hypothetical protein
VALADNCQHEVALFLKQPSHKNYLMLKKIDPSENSNACWLDLKADTQNLAELYAHASRGNEWAIKMLASHLSTLDGGELEDAYRALGKSVDAKPNILLQTFKDQVMTQNQFTQAMVMLPLTFVDNKSGTLSALKTRKKKILSIKDTKLDTQKSIAARVISEHIAQIDKIWP